MARLPAHTTDLLTLLNEILDWRSRFDRASGGSAFYVNDAGRERLEEDSIVRLDQLIGQVGWLREYLKTLEWVSVPGPVVAVRCCPVCEVIRRPGAVTRHGPHCWLALACDLPHD